MRHTTKWQLIELKFSADRESEQPHMDQGMRINFVSPSDHVYTSSGFWDGGRSWMVRFAPNEVGSWKWSSSSGDTGLDGKSGFFEVHEYTGDNPLHQHGFISARDRGFVHDDGTPFFWLGDTVWSISAHAELPEWQRYLDYRNKQGFNVVQINSLPQWDASDADYRKPFAMIGEDYDYTRINESYFQYLDKLMEASKAAGMITAMVVLWFNYVPETNLSWGKEWKKPMYAKTAKAFGAYLSARYAAYGTVWLISGDTDYESKTAEQIYDAAAWAVKEASPYPALLTAHLNGGLFTPYSLNEKEWLDFHMLQSCHFSYSADKALEYADKDREYSPVRPVLNGEPCYDYLRLMDKNNIEDKLIDRDLVREVAWVSLLGGANAGLTYGAHGIWPWHREGQSYGPMNYGMPLPWEEALHLESSEDMARMKNLLEVLPWWELQPLEGVHVDKADIRVTASVLSEDQYLVVYIGESADVFLPASITTTYSGFWFDPQTGTREKAAIRNHTPGTVIKPSWSGDSVLVLENISNV